ncbi:MAG: hypothetical protein COB78_13055 [Hyphomicrobiales bacterium]|nr:MAG: hypothetical protein COB78_13055 [Hyphomicrobiales bacterium]
MLAISKVIDDWAVPLTLSSIPVPFGNPCIDVPFKIGYFVSANCLNDILRLPGDLQRSLQIN